MQIAVICNEAQKAELLSDGMEESAVSWLTDISGLSATDVVIDLQFQNTPDRIEALQKAAFVIVNSVAETTAETDPSFVRINGWNGFLKNNIIEAAGNEAAKEAAVEALSRLNKNAEWLPDEPGFVTPRVISMIINEAYHALSEGVSTKEEIDTAMKLGTAYPYGPFEWGEKIGLQNVADLLNTLAMKQERYKPSALLLQ
ncbi:MAG: hypothetical protein JWP88_2017, partial [Flaviaesturariibacter sp.]|nr:hypothetical protein [Flaviaesturariibacter sp.]